MCVIRFVHIYHFLTTRYQLLSRSALYYTVPNKLNIHMDKLRNINGQQ